MSFSITGNRISTAVQNALEPTQKSELNIDDLLIEQFDFQIPFEMIYQKMIESLLHLLEASPIYKEQKQLSITLTRDCLRKVPDQSHEQLLISYSKAMDFLAKAKKFFQISVERKNSAVFQAFFEINGGTKPLILSIIFFLCCNSSIVNIKIKLTDINQYLIKNLGANLPFNKKTFQTIE